ncbi:MAG TPA: glycosyltransferase family 4 protein [Dokdonella sp.]|uniref:glycosyltransferase family 4 protein n=1 Tax=Dokdonella sp. TaxID=2291710 RepID=UPI002B8DD972|nr:glycosyltransferase family 4 protein [Dokdonella sp.]HNV07511.1 glycosyltransferase family 4 protein [Dokdonella sp.]HPW02668.1 glycosyltransferase family 4 protein [Dokdonella sp.]
MKPRIAIVTIRCHEKLVGGAEALAWQYAGLLTGDFAVEILTSSAFDYTHWKNDLAVGEEDRDGILIRRFKVVRGRTAYFHGLHQLMLDAFAQRKETSSRLHYGWPEALEEEFIHAQGPNCPDLLTHLREHGDGYAAVFFLPYLYPMILDGIRAMPHRRWALIPALHDEPPAYLETFAHMGRSAPRILWNTLAEKRLGARIWNLEGGNVVSMTVAVEPAAAAVEEKPYLLYCGRIDVSKGCAALLEGFDAYKRANPRSPLQLVLTGNDVLGVGKRRDVRYLGFVDEERKFELMAGAVAFVQPSPYESLSIVLLEAMAQRAPVIVNGQCEVLVDHVHESQSGYVYRNQGEFIDAVSRVLVLGSGARAEQGAKAREYVLKNYSEAQVSARLRAEVDALLAL